MKSSEKLVLLKAEIQKSYVVPPSIEDYIYQFCVLDLGDEAVRNFMATRLVGKVKTHLYHLATIFQR